MAPRVEDVRRLCRGRGARGHRARRGGAGRRGQGDLRGGSEHRLQRGGDVCPEGAGHGQVSELGVARERHRGVERRHRACAEVAVGAVRHEEQLRVRLRCGQVRADLHQRPLQGHHGLLREAGAMSGDGERAGSPRLARDGVVERAQRRRHGAGLRGQRSERGRVLHQVHALLGQQLQVRGGRARRGELGPGDAGAACGRLRGEGREALRDAGQGSSRAKQAT